MCNFLCWCRIEGERRRRITPSAEMSTFAYIILDCLRVHQLYPISLVAMCETMCPNTLSEGTVGLRPGGPDVKQRENAIKENNTKPSAFD